MSSKNQPSEQRNHNRYQLKDPFYVIIQGIACDTPARVADLSKNGIGFYALDEEKQLQDKFILLDLVTNNNQIMLRSLSGRIVFSKDERGNGEDTDEATSRCGLQFINLSSLQKKQLGIITRKYARSENENNLPCMGIELTPMVPWKGIPK
jgi:c-di-GMP-binding flagellar brake protein YcgR